MWEVLFVSAGALNIAEGSSIEFTGKVWVWAFETIES